MTTETRDPGTPEASTDGTTLATPPVAGPSPASEACGDTGRTISEESGGKGCNQYGELPGMLPLGPRRNVVTSKRELARRLGYSHAAVLRAERDGRISALPDGAYDVDACRAAWDANTKRTRPRATRVAPVETSESTQAAAMPRGNNAPPLAAAGDRGAERVEVPPEATTAVIETLREHGIDIVGTPTLRDATTALEILRTWKAKVDVDSMLGKKVDREKAHGVLTTFTRSMRDSLLAWPKAAAPLVAHELGIADARPLEMALLAALRARLDAIARVPPPDEMFPPPQ